MGAVQATHYCGGEPVKSEWSLLAVDVDCGMNEQTECPTNTQQQRYQPEPCCEDHYQRFQVDEASIAPSLSVAQLLVLPLAAPVVLRSHSLKLFALFPLSTYPLPPPLGASRLLLYQTFRI